MTLVWQQQTDNCNPSGPTCACVPPEDAPAYLGQLARTSCAQPSSSSDSSSSSTPDSSSSSGPCGGVTCTWLWSGESWGQSFNSCVNVGGCACGTGPTEPGSYVGETRAGYCYYTG